MANRRQKAIKANGDGDVCYCGDGLATGYAVGIRQILLSL